MAAPWNDLASGTDGAALVKENYAPIATGVVFTGGTQTVRTSGGAFGSRRHVQEVGTAGTSGQVGRYFSITATDQLAAAYEVAIVAYPSAETSTMNFTASSVRQVGVSMTALGELSVYDKNATRRWDGVATKSPPLPTGVPLCISMVATRSDTAGSYHVVVTNLATGAVLANSGVQTGINTGTSSFGAVWTGVKVGTSTIGGEFDSAGIAVASGATDVVAPRLMLPTPPTVTLTADQNVAAGSTATATADATDDGTIASYAWTVLASKSSTSPALTGAGTATVTFTAPAAGHVVTLQCVVTDDSGNATTRTTEVRVPKSGNFATLAVPGTTYTNVGGAANTGAALADASDATYAESPSYTATATEFRQRLEPLVPRTALTITVRHMVTAAGGVKKFRLYEGTTLRQEWTLTQPTTMTDEALTVTNPGAIVDWGALHIAEVVST